MRAAFVINGATPALRVGAALLLAVAAFSACAHEAAAAPPVQNPASVATSGAPTQPGSPAVSGAAPAARGGAAVLDSEAAAIEAAKQNPISHPEPRTLYPDQTPPPRPERGLPDKQPPPREERGLPTQAPGPRSSAAVDGAAPGAVAEDPAGELDEPQTRVIAPEQPPLAPLAEERPFAPASDYVWAPGYWYWYGGRYVWVAGGWVAPRPGYVYVSARWTYANDGWVFAPGGWAVGFGSRIAYPVYPYYWHRDHYRGHRYWHEPHYGGGRAYPPYARDERYPRYERSRVQLRPAPSHRIGSAGRGAAPAPRGSATGTGGSRAIPRNSATVRRSGDRIRVYPERR